MENLKNEFIESSLFYFRQNYPRIEKCFNELSENEVWQHPNNSSNSVANLTLHLCGNITQYIISALGGNADNRDRDSEFTADSTLNKARLLVRLKEVTDNAAAIINSTDDNMLSRNYSVQGYSKSGIAIIIHVTEHYSYHTGQIVFYTKMLKNIDTGFYKGMDLNKKNI